MQTRLKAYLPLWTHDWLDVILPLLQIVLILLVTLLLLRLMQRVIRRASDHYQFPHELLKPIRAVGRWLLVGSAGLLILERLGVSASVLWTAFTGFATVGAVAFFAAWSVLSNLFCALLIVSVGPYRLGDHIELVDSGDKPGVLGRVVDINLLYTTLEDATAPEPGTLLQIPNSLIFQRVLRRWRAGTPVPAERLVPLAPPLAENGAPAKAIAPAAAAVAAPPRPAGA
ncbi:Mechanosensitive ion channel [Oryzisolibacter propanilivorax]|uniref:Small-conductance mechanosensitive channel n=1 Tax=Oryzisolibacter propanilivorax TaxID=1527607 RepID=A0A1G9R5J2_9BURK|nr:mechanosensitive ion channel family protein [Oryzisolibacter propanilivorax]SDM18097.1 Mechanosensitive ion channel [Oryzisolibacter propanilivorax]